MLSCFVLRKASLYGLSNVLLFGNPEFYLLLNALSIINEQDFCHASVVCTPGKHG